MRGLCVPPEVVFDQDIGDLFVLGVAGNVLDPHILGSIQCAVEHLGTRVFGTISARKVAFPTNTPR